MIMVLIGIAWLLIILIIGYWLSRYRGITKPDPECVHKPHYVGGGSWHCAKCGVNLKVRDVLRRQA